MDCRKGWKTNADGVIARLMGLQQLRPRQSFHDNRRALSDSYIRRSATVGLRPGSLVSVGRSRRTKNETEHFVKDVSGIDVSKGGDGVDLDNSKSWTTSKGMKSTNPSGASLSESSSRATYQDKKSCDKRGEENALNCEQKSEHDLVAGYQGELGINCVKSFNLQSDVVVNPSFMETKLERVINGFKVGKSGIYSKSGCRGQIESLRPKSVNCHPKPSPDKKLVNEVKSLGRHCIGCTRNINSVSRQVQGGRKFSEMSIRGYMHDNYLVNGQDIKNAYAKHLSLNQLHSSNRSQKQNFGRWARTKGVSRIEFSGRAQCRTDVMALDGKELVVVKIEAMSNGWNLQQDDSTPKENKLKQQTVYQIDNSKPKGVKYFDQLQTTCDVHGLQPNLNTLDYIQGVQDEVDSGSEDDRFREIELSKKILKSSNNNLTAQNMNDPTYASPEGFGTVVCSRSNGEPPSVVNPAILSGEDGRSSGVLGDFSGEASMTEFSEESSYSNSSRIGTPDFQENPKRACQHSPDSVLEPFDGKYSPTDGCFDSIGLQFNLDILNLEAEDAYSEGSMMGVSGDDDSEEHFADLSHDGRKIKRWLRDDESQNFSYMVDVLDEAGFCGTKSCMDFKRWHSLECPINPLVFEALEKKYGKQTSWPQSERQLLFDSMNSGLMCILNPVMNFNKSIKGFVYANLRRDEVEDALWTILVHQQEEKNKGSSKRIAEKWLEGEEGMNIICNELEISLLDELVDELVISLIDG